MARAIHTEHRLAPRQPKRKGANSETARDINRSLVLNAIRTGQPVSRAELARQTGLQRSTVSLIIEQLMQERWVVERGVARLPRGRNPTLITLNLEKTAIIGVNVMPRLTTIVLGDLNSDLHASRTFPTGRIPRRFLAELARQVGEVRRNHPETTFEAIGISLPGRVDRFTQKLVFAPNLGWRNVDLKTPLEQATGLPVLVDNAANACALAEVWSGPLAGAQDLIAVTISEGIGTGIIANGQLVRGPNGAAGEFGHVCLNPAGPRCRCGSRGCWEVYASNNAALRAYRAAARAVPGARPASVRTFNDLLTLAAQGDARASRVLDGMGEALGLGLAMIINGMAPAVISIVGEVTRAWRRVGPIIDKVVAERARTHAATRILPTDDVLQPRLRGTVALVLQKHFRPSLLA